MIPVSKTLETDIAVVVIFYFITFCRRYLLQRRGQVIG